MLIDIRCKMVFKHHFAKEALSPAPALLSHCLFLSIECVMPRYELPTGTFTFYYMELALEAKLQRKVNQLKEILTKSKGQIQYDWKAVQYIQSR